MMDIEEFIKAMEVNVPPEEVAPIIATEEPEAEQALYERVTENIKIWKQKILDGGVNCIPLGFPRFEAELPGIEQKSYIQITANTKVGKCFGKGTEVVMYDGTTKKVEDIQEEDILMGPDNQKRIVKGVNRGVEPMYNIYNGNELLMQVNESHILYLCKVIHSNYSTYKKKYTSKRPTKYEYVTMSVKEYLDIPDTQKKNYRMVHSGEIEFYSNPVEIDPYFYGLWLGDGDTAQLCITNTDPEVIDYLQEFATNNNLKISLFDPIRYNLIDDTKISAINSNGEVEFITSTISEMAKLSNCREEYVSRAANKDKKVDSFYFTYENKRGTFRNKFKESCGFNKERIKETYLRASIKDRYRLLAGLIDSDGYKKNTNYNCYEIVSKYESLIKDIKFLADSLGFRTKSSSKLNKKTNNTYYYLTISGKSCNELPLKIKRKKSDPTSLYRKNMCSFSVESIGEGEYYGFTVDKDHLFLLSNFYIVHNTQITDYLLLYNSVLFAKQNPDKLRLKLFYFTLEMSKEQKELQIMSHLLWVLSKGRVRVSPKELRSVSADSPLEDEIIDLLESDEYVEYFKFFEKHVEFIDSIRNPFGIYKFMREYAQANGKQHTKVIEKLDKATGDVVETVVDDYYEAYDPDEYVVIIVDHMALLTAENGKTVRDAMIKLSSDYFVTLRNKYRYIPVAVVQQAMAQESNENMKLNKLKPTLDGYGDAKVIARDADLILGLFSPYRHNIRDYEGYNIETYKDNIRFMELIAGREGGGGSVCPLYFDGAVNYFRELPLPKDKEGMEQANRMLTRIREKGRILQPEGKSFFTYSLKDKIKQIFK